MPKQYMVETYLIRADESIITLFDERFETLREWARTRDAEMEAAVYLSDHDAETISVRQRDGSITTTWEMDVPDLNDDPEYDEWIDARWAEMQDHFAMLDDAMERGA